MTPHFIASMTQWAWQSPQSRSRRSEVYLRLSMRIKLDWYKIYICKNNKATHRVERLCCSIHTKLFYSAWKWLFFSKQSDNIVFSQYDLLCKYLGSTFGKQHCYNLNCFSGGGGVLCSTSNNVFCIASGMIDHTFIYVSFFYFLPKERNISCQQSADTFKSHWVFECPGIKNILILLKWNLSENIKEDTSRIWKGKWDHTHWNDDAITKQCYRLTAKHVFLFFHQT